MSRVRLWTVASDLSVPVMTRNSVMRPAKGSATVFQTNAAYGSLAFGVAATSAFCFVSVAANWPLGRGGQVVRRSRRAPAACRCSGALTRRRAGRSCRSGSPCAGRPPVPPASACPPRRTSPSARRRLLPPSRSARRARLSRRPTAAPGSRPSVALPLPSAGYVHAFIATRSMTPREILLLADRQLDRDDGAAAEVAEGGQRAVEARALAIEPVDDDEAGQAERLGLGPYLFGLHLDAGDRIDDEHRRVGDAERQHARRRGSCPCRGYR